MSPSSQNETEQHISQVFSLFSIFQGKPLRQDVSSGVILSNQTLVIQRVRRTHAGALFCRADNVEGAGKSNRVDLRIKCEFHILTQGSIRGRFRVVISFTKRGGGACRKIEEGKGSRVGKITIPTSSQKGEGVAAGFLKEKIGWGGTEGPFI